MSGDLHVHVGGGVERRTAHHQEQAAIREALESGIGGQTQYTTRRTRLSQYLAACGVVYGRGGAQLS